MAVLCDHDALEMTEFLYEPARAATAQEVEVAEEDNFAEIFGVYVTSLLKFRRFFWYLDG